MRSAERTPLPPRNSDPKYVRISTDKVEMYAYSSRRMR